MASITELENRRGQLLEEIALYSAQAQQDQRLLARARDSLAFERDPARQAGIRGNIAGYERRISEANAKLATLNQQLAEIDSQLAQLRAANQQPTDNAGAESANASQARDENANATVPPQPPPPTAAATNADQYSPAQDTTATQAEVRRIDNLMSVPPVTAEPGAARGGSERPANPDLVDGESTSRPEPTPTISRGAGAAGDDATAVRTFIDQTFGGTEQQIKWTNNPLSQLASYTYNISIYIMDSKEFKRFILGKKRTVAGSQLLIRSGGAGPAGTLVPSDQLQAEDPVLAAQERVAGLGRNEFFTLDYYLDDVRINHLIMGKGTGAAHNSTDLTFRIIEPNGITFLDNLYRATQQYIALRGGKGPQNYAAQNYLMHIKFIGYDESGKIITNQKLPVTDRDGKQTLVTVEKFIPFQFSEIKFRVANKLTEYECKAVAIPNSVGIGPARATIPYNVELQSQTLKELFNGNLSYGTTTSSAGRTGSTAGSNPFLNDQPAPGIGVAETEYSGFTDALGNYAGTLPVTAGKSPTQNSAPPKASAAPQPELVTGLVKALNQFQEDQVKAGKQQLPDKYDVVIVSDILESAKVMPPGEVNLRQTPMVKTEDPAQAKLGSKQSVANNTKSTKILAGKSILAFIDEVVRSSSYIYNQQIKIIDPKTGKITVNGKPASTVAWFKIGIEVDPQGDDFYDNIRNDFAYNITYQISPYAVSDVKSEWFPRSRFRGTHKRYDYWFTGKNTEILDFTQDYNYLFYMVQTAPNAQARNIYNTRELERAFTQPNSNQTNQGIDNNVNEPQANATDYLYSPGDQSRIKLKILGDPTWIQQGELSNGVQRQNFDYKPFLADGTINYDSQDILFEINFNSPVDYNLSTGIMDPTTKNFNKQYDSQGKQTKAGDARNSFVYQAVKCTSIFSKGRFEQELEGVLRTWPDPNAKTNSAKTDQKEQVAAGGKPQTQGRTAQIDLPEASPGLSGLEAGESGTVNYNSPGLAQVLDQQPKASKPLTGSSLAAEGFDNNALGLPESAPPTSGTQTVGPASSSTAAVAAQGGASGTNVGQPVTQQVFLTKGGVVNVSSNEQIQDLYNRGQISAQERSQAAQALNIRQNAANSPTTTAPKQVMNRET